MLKKLVDALNATGYPFAEYGWSTKPTGDYGVVSADGSSQLRANNDSAAEKLLEGAVDLFTADFGSAPLSAIENVLRTAGLSWSLEDLQFEKSTGYLHYTWSWKGPDCAPNICRIRFVMHGKTVEQWKIKGELPDEPLREGYIDDDGLCCVRTNWDTPIAPAAGDTNYTAEYHPFGFAQSIRVYNGKTPDENGLPTQTQHWTQTQLEAFRRKTRDEGVAGKAVWISEMRTYAHIGNLSIRAQGTEGVMAFPPNSELWDAKFQI